VEEIKQLSTHLTHDRLQTDWLEIWLEDWGVWHNERILELCSPVRSSLKTIEEMRSEQLEPEIPQLYYMHNGEKKKHPSWYCRLLYELRKMWHKPNMTSTRSTQGRTPNFMPHRRMDKINRAIFDLQPHHYGIILMKYEQRLDFIEINKQIGMPRATYFRRLKAAKKELRKSLKSLTT